MVPPGWTSMARTLPDVTSGISTTPPWNPASRLPAAVRRTTTPCPPRSPPTRILPSGCRTTRLGGVASETGGPTLGRQDKGATVPEARIEDARRGVAGHEQVTGVVVEPVAVVRPATTVAPSGWTATASTSSSNGDRLGLHQPTSEGGVDGGGAAVRDGCRADGCRGGRSLAEGAGTGRRQRRDEGDERAYAHAPRPTDRRRTHGPPLSTAPGAPLSPPKRRLTYRLRSLDRRRSSSR